MLTPPGQMFRETRKAGSNSPHRSMETQPPEKHTGPSGPDRVLGNTASGAASLLSRPPLCPTQTQIKKASLVPLQSLVLNSPLVNSLSKDGVESYMISNKGSI